MGEGASVMQSRAPGVSSAHAHHDSCRCHCSRVDCRRPSRPARPRPPPRRASPPRSACTEFVTLGGGPGRSMIYRTYSLDTRNDAMRRALIMVHGTNRNADHYFETVDRRRVSRRRARGHRRHRAAHDRSDRQARRKRDRRGRAAGARAGRRARRPRCRRSISSTRSSASSRTRRRSPT